MLEHVTAVVARIQDIKTRFRSDAAAGIVSVAPHAVASGGSRTGSVQPFFPQYLLKQINDGEASSKPTDYENEIRLAAAKHNIDPALIKAVIRAESGFNPNAVSHSGAQGLMQLMPSTAAGFGVTDPFDPAQNIDAGAHYLRGQLDRFGGDVSLALAAYNAGPGSVAKYNGVPPFRETQNYVKRVLDYYDTYRRDADNEMR
jgi:soluble lytic murein transglycosylase-like protein